LNAKAEIKAEFKTASSYQGGTLAMARERTGFIVSQVFATVEYIDGDGQHQKLSKAAKVPAADSKKHLSESQK
jgi:hypothetical protein